MARRTSDIYKSIKKITITTLKSTIYILKCFSTIFDYRSYVSITTTYSSVLFVIKMFYIFSYFTSISERF